MKHKKLVRAIFAVLATASTMLVTATTAQTVTQVNVLHAFGISNGDGSTPNSGLISDSNGNLFGTTSLGGAYGFGIVFELSPQPNGLWKESILYSFNAGNDGYSPFGGLIVDAAGNLYGTATTGGNMKCSQGCGTIFELTPAAGNSWTYAVLYRFQGGPDGVTPLGPLALGSSGNLYGVTRRGGTSGKSSFGTVFELSQSQGTWVKSLLYDFLGGADGKFPTGGLIIDGLGNLYGATGGINCKAECGNVFELTPNSGGTWTETVLHSFRGGLGYSPDGSRPSGSLIFDSTGNIYGMTAEGGGSHHCVYSCGSVFKLTPGSTGWTETMIYAFNFDRHDGAYPTGALLFDSTGNLYGATLGGGSTADCRNGCGTVFELSQGAGDTWTETILYRFRGGKNGGVPNGSLWSDSLGNLYGTTTRGLDSSGVAYQLTP